MIILLKWTDFRYYFLLCSTRGGGGGGGGGGVLNKVIMLFWKLSLIERWL